MYAEPSAPHHLNGHMYTHTHAACMDRSQEGRVLEEEESAAAAGVVARAFVAEVCSLIEGDSAQAQARAAEALLGVLREARAAGRQVNPALAAALVEVGGRGMGGGGLGVVDGVVVVVVVWEEGVVCRLGLGGGGGGCAWEGSWLRCGFGFWGGMRRYG
jgi:hypothetical protein